MNIGNLPEIDDVYEDDEVVFSQDGVHLAKTKAKNMGVGGAGLRYWKEDSEKIYRLVQNDGHKWVDNGKFGVAGNAEVIIFEREKTITDPIETILPDGTHVHHQAHVVSYRWLFRRLSNKRVLGGLCAWRFWGDTTTSRLPSYDVSVDGSPTDSRKFYLPGWALISTRKEDLIYQFIKVNVETGEEEVLQTINPLNEPEVYEGIEYYVSGHPDPELIESLILRDYKYSDTSYELTNSNAWIVSPWAWKQTYPSILQGAILTTEDGEETWDWADYGILAAGQYHYFPVTEGKAYEGTGIFYKRVNGRWEITTKNYYRGGVIPTESIPAGATIRYMTEEEYKKVVTPDPNTVYIVTFKRVIDDGQATYTRYDHLAPFTSLGIEGFGDASHACLSGHNDLIARQSWGECRHRTSDDGAYSPFLSELRVVSVTHAPDWYNSFFMCGDDIVVNPMENYIWHDDEFAWLGCVDNVWGIPYAGVPGDVGFGKDVMHYIWHDAGIIHPAYYFTAIDIGIGTDQYVFYSGEGNDTSDPQPSPYKANFKLSRQGIVDAAGYLLNGKEIEGVETIDVVPVGWMGPNPTKLATITTSADELDIYTPTPTFNTLYDESTGVKIGTFNFKTSSTDVYAPSGGSGGGNVELTNVYSPPDIYTQTQRICTVNIGTTHTDLVAPVTNIKSISVTPVGSSGTRIAYIDIMEQGASAVTRKNIYVPTDDKSNWFGKAETTYASSYLDISNEIDSTYSGTSKWINYSRNTGFQLQRYVNYRFDCVIKLTGDASVAWPDTNDEYLYLYVQSGVDQASTAAIPIKYVKNHGANTSIGIAVSGIHRPVQAMVPSVRIKFGLGNATGSYTCRSIVAKLTFTALDP